jgi:hypothetical protein
MNEEYLPYLGHWRNTVRKELVLLLALGDNG